MSITFCWPYGRSLFMQLLPNSAPIKISPIALAQIVHPCNDVPRVLKNTTPCLNRRYGASPLHCNTKYTATGLNSDGVGFHWRKWVSKMARMCGLGATSISLSLGILGMMELTSDMILLLDVNNVHWSPHTPPPFCTRERPNNVDPSTAPALDPSQWTVGHHRSILSTRFFPLRHRDLAGFCYCCHYGKDNCQ